MNVFSGVAIYLVIWWVVLFAVLPLGMTSHHQAGIDPGDGGDPGAPVNPNLKRKFITTTWVAAVVWLVLWLILRFDLVPLDIVPTG